MECTAPNPDSIYTQLHRWQQAGHLKQAEPYSPSHVHYLAEKSSWTKECVGLPIIPHRKLKKDWSHGSPVTSYYGSWTGLRLWFPAPTEGSQMPPVAVLMPSSASEGITHICSAQTHSRQSIHIHKVKFWTLFTCKITPGFDESLGAYNADINSLVE